MEKRGQVTIFIIVAIVIVALAVLIFLFYPKIQSTLGFGSEKSPSQFMQECIEDEVQEAVDKLSSQGGSLNPEHYFVYLNEQVEYLCYTNQYYVPCVMQQPMLKKHIEQEIKSAIQTKSEKCFDDLEKSFKKQGYSVDLKKADLKVELLPKRVAVSFGNELTISKSSTEKYDSIRVVLNNNLYELVSIVNSILNWEAKYGDAETTTYMNYYHDLKVEKKKQTDGTTVYVLTDRNNLNKFQFASRSVAWPPGYGTEKVLG
jgi:hypothetical protein